MSIPKKGNITHTKKYNPESDIVPLHPTGFGVAINDKDDSILILDFITENIRNTSGRVEIVLGSYAISKNMAEDIIKLLTNALEHNYKKEEK